MELQVQFIVKTTGMRNNVKSYMIQKLLHDLRDSLNKPDEKVVLTPLEITLSPPPVCENYMRTVHEDERPCLNMNCVFIEFMSVFFQNTEFWLLPAYNKMSHCYICELADKGTLNLSKLIITKNGFVKHDF